MKTSYRFPAGFVSPEELLANNPADTPSYKPADKFVGKPAGETAGEPADRSADTPSGNPSSVLVGFSGGADSTALLDALCVWAKQSGAKILAAHVNHGIRGDEAIRDREFCRAFCRDRNIPFFCLDSDVPGEKRPGESLETAARRVRYAYFEDLMQKGRIPVLALAHHADDNLETVLFRLCRGTGLRGLCGIPPVRPFGCGTLIRPLIGVTKAEILRYCNERGLSFVTDSTNGETDAARNRIRNNVLPALAEVAGDPTAAVTRMTRLLRADLDYLEAETDRLIAGDDRATEPAGSDGDGAHAPCRLVGDDRERGNSPDLRRPTHLSRRALAGAPYAVASRAIARMYEAAGGDPGAVHIDALLDFCRSGTAHGVFPLPGNKNARVTVTYDDVRVEKNQKSDVTVTYDDVRVENKKSRTAVANDDIRVEKSKESFTAANGVQVQKNIAAHATANGADLPGSVPLAPEKEIRFGRFTVSAEVIPYREMCRRFGADAFSRKTTEGDPSRKNPTPDIQPSQCGPKVYNLSIRIPFKSDKIKGNRIHLRARRPGDRILSNGLHKDVRRLLSACRLPPALRGELPLLCDGNGILAVPFCAARDGTYPDRTTPPDLPVLLCSVTLRDDDVCGES